MLGRFLSLAAAFLIVFGIQSSGALAQQTPGVTNDQVLRAFAGITLGAEHEQRKPRILKWQKPIRIALIGNAVPDWVEQMLVDHIRDLTLTTGHPVTLAYSERLRKEKRLVPYVRQVQFNFMVFVEPKAELPASVEKWTKGAFKAAQVQGTLEKGSCFGNLRVNKSGVITFGYAGIPLEIATQRTYVTTHGTRQVDPKLFMKACVVEETTQLMGPINDIDTAEFTIFSDKSKAIDLTPEDRTMLKMLYHPSIKPGMGPKDTVAAARALIGKLRPAQ